MVSFKLPSTGKAIADLTVLPIVHKSRKPKFELHLKIYDLNNVPLVSGVSSVKWHLPHSLHNEHRGRTHKQPISNHRVEYKYAKIIPLRLVVDRNNRLSDYPIEFEITQEFETHGASRDEKMLLGRVTLNLAEYVAESEAILRDARPGASDSPRTSFTGNEGGHRDPPPGGWHARQRSSMSTKATLNSFATTETAESNTSGQGGAPSTAGSSTASLSTSGASPVEDGVIRRYLMQDSKINSTLKVSILMVQLDGERNFVAPALKSAPVFGGITGIVTSGEVISGVESNFEDPDDNSVGGVVSALMSTSASKGPETTEIQDVYRRALAASWACQPGELPADECIEDIFGGGDGFRASGTVDASASSTVPTRQHSGASSTSPLPAGTSLASAIQKSGWSPSSPTHSSIHERDEDEPSALSRTPSGGKKHASRILPKLGPIRRKTLPVQAASERSAFVKSKFRENDGGARNSGSGDDGLTGGRSSSSGGSGNGSGNNSHQDDEDGDYEHGNNATLRPSDVRKFRGQAVPSSTSALAALRFPGREESGLSDRTVTVRVDAEAEVPRSSRSSPGPQSSSFGHRRNGSLENVGAAAVSGAGRAADLRGQRETVRTPTGRVPSTSRQNSGSGHDDQSRTQPEVLEFEVRDDYVAWQLPDSGSIAASS